MYDSAVADLQPLRNLAAAVRPIPCWGEALVEFAFGGIGPMRTAILTLVTLAACSDASVTDPASPNARAGANASSNAPVVFNTQLRPDNEVRTTAEDPVQSTARGPAQIKLFADNTLEFKITVQNPAGETFILGHIHQAPVGVNGPIVVNLLGTISESGTLLKFEGTRDVPADIAAALRENPAGFYVNLHTTIDPTGAMRGQLP
jgi:CHRD domain